MSGRKKLQVVWLCPRYTNPSITFRYPHAAFFMSAVLLQIKLSYKLIVRYII